MHGLVRQVKKELLSWQRRVDRLGCACREQVRRVLSGGLPRDTRAVCAAGAATIIAQVVASAETLMRKVIAAAREEAEEAFKPSESGRVVPSDMAQVPLSYHVCAPTCSTQKLGKQSLVQRQAVRLSVL